MTTHQWVMKPIPEQSATAVRILRALRTTNNHIAPMPPTESQIVATLLAGAIGDEITHFIH